MTPLLSEQRVGDWWHFQGCTGGRRFLFSRRLFQSQGEQGDRREVREGEETEALTSPGLGTASCSSLCPRRGFAVRDRVWRRLCNNPFPTVVGSQQPQAIWMD